MSGLILTITDAGRAALVNAANTGTDPVLMASVGISATAFTPSPATTSLPDEIKRISTIAGDVVADDTIHVTVRDESADVYTVRSFGLYLADGTLFAVYSQTSPIMEKSAQAMLLLAIDVTFADIDATDITFGDTGFLNPPATTERQGIVELATEAETIAGDDATRAVVPKGLKSAVTSWINARFGEGAPSNFVKSLLTSASAAALRTALEIKSAALKDEGAGKGLDADLLDGQQGSFYQNASNLNAGTVPAARLAGSYDINISGNAATSTKLATARTLSLTGDVTGSASFDGSANAAIAATLTAAKVREKLLTVDGSGSGVDADMLDGLHGDQFMRSDTTAATVGFYNPTAATDLNTIGRLSYRAVIPFNSGYQPANRPAGNYVSGVDLGSQLENYRWQLVSAFPTANRFFARQLHAGVWQNWVEFWHTGNDGSGSGMDADLLDGKHASAFAEASHNHDASAITQGVLDNERIAGGQIPARSKDIAANFDIDTLSGTTANFYHVATNANASTISSLPIAKAGTLINLKWNHARATQFFAGYSYYADLYIRSQTDDATWTTWKKFWNDTNDGSGSGLDADLLDGQQGSFYQNASNLDAGTVPAARLSGTYSISISGNAGTATKLATARTLALTGDVTGSASFDGSANAALAATFTAAKVLEKLVTVDGSGSGVDADLLDGLHANAFVKQTDFTGSNQSLGLNGYQKLPGGLIIQAGQVSVGANATAVVTWPIAFPNRCIAAVCSGGETDPGREHNPPAFYAWGPTSGSIFNAIDTTIATRWIAIGH